jgi:hypothetical protein
MVRRAREGFLKAALGLLLAASACPVSADELLTGALRDQDGAAVAGARITAFDRSGAVVAHDRSAPDGTFALTAALRPAALAIEADDSDPLRVAVGGDGPVTAILHRHRAADPIPSAADVAALPAGGFAAVGSVLPFEVAGESSISDRWLARGRGVTTIEGLPFYRRTDGADASDLLPDHAIGSIGFTEPLEAPWYGDRAGGGILDARLFDRTDAALAGSDGYAVELGGTAAIFGATSWGADGERRVIAAHADGSAGPVAASFVALLGDLTDEYYRGAGVTLRGATRALNLDAQLGYTDDVEAGSGSLQSGTVSSVIIDAVGNGPDAIAVRARWRDERGAIGDATTDHTDAALVAGVTRGAADGPHLSASVALTFGRESGYDGNAQTGLALLPALAYDVPLGDGWSLHTGYGESTLGAPGTAIARADMGEAGFSYTDHRRLRAELLAYAEGDAAPLAFTRGIGGSLGWEIVPRVSLRAWLLGDGDAQTTFVASYPGATPAESSQLRTVRRDVVWLTWDAAARFDLLLRNGALEGSLRAPLGDRYGFVLGSARNARNVRVVSAGLTRSR